jgi:hypothetical protein
MRSTPDFDFGLTESAAMIREAAGRFADEQILPLAAEIDRNDRFPRELWEPMGALGLHGITVALGEESCRPVENRLGEEHLVTGLQTVTNHLEDSLAGVSARAGRNLIAVHRIHVKRNINMITIL